MTDTKISLTTEAVLRARIEKLIENGRKAPLVKRTQGFFELKIKDLNKLWDQYQDIDLQIHQCIQTGEIDEDDKYITEDRYGKLENKYSDYSAELLNSLRILLHPNVITQEPTTSNAAHSSQNNNTTVYYQESALPKIIIPKYNGEYELWRPFRDLFVSVVHNNQRLTSVQKLYHLKSCLTGEAEKLLRHTPITDADYEPAWTKLQERYENKKILVNHQLKLLVNQNKITTERIKDIKALVDTTNECLQQLKSLNVDTSSWDVLIIHILIQKLPYLTLRLWEESQGTSQELPKLSEFLQFLQKRISVLEAVSDAVTANSSRSKQPVKSATMTHLVTANNKCPACNQQHYIIHCQKYKKLAANEKLKIITSSGRCLNCFSRQHFVNSCPHSHRCSKCHGKHHSTLHDACSDKNIQRPIENIKRTNNRINYQLDASTSGEYREGIAPKAQSQLMNGVETKNTVHTFITTRDQQPLLSTALVIAQAYNKEPQVIRCLLDTGSQSSFITEDACQRLKASWKRTSTTVTGLNTSHAAFATRQTKLELQSCQAEKTKITENFFIIKQITDTLPNIRIENHKYAHLQGLPLADPTYWQPGKIDALLGAQAFAKIIQEGVRRGPVTAPVAVKTLFGWMLLGSTNERKNNSTAAFTITTCDASLEKQLRKFWETEEVMPKSNYSKEENECQQIFESTTERLSNGKYQVQLPFVDNTDPMLGQSREQAIKRYAQLKRKFSTNPTLEQDYSKCLNEYLELGHMEMVEPPMNETKNYYIPHHAVFKESTTTKLRVVFDASAKTTNGYSLNDFLLKGPTIQPKLFSTLLNWRKHKIALNADIAKMYRMITIHPKHRTYQRIIWHHPVTKEIQDFQLNTVTFGTSAAPYLAIRTLQQLATDAESTWPKASQEIKNACYVDDVLTGADTIEEAECLQTNLIDLLQSGGFKLRKWASNEPRLLDRLPREYREPKSERYFSEDESIKALGIQWHPAQDYFSFKLNATSNDTLITKRIILSEISRLYDPLGWLAPILIRGKLLMQLLWITGVHWDTQVSKPIENLWNEFKNDLKNIERITIPRWIHYTTQAHIQLHGFCDASQKAYAAVIYMRVILPDGNIVTHLLTSKTRVAPVKPTTIPRLELNGAVLLARLMQVTTNDLKLQDVPMFAWTDSTIVLQWIQEHPSKWKTYVANRVVEIQEIIKFEKWKHVPTKSNPADLASRGVLADQLINHELWWHGPQWLSKHESNWPKYDKNLGHTTHEEKTTNHLNFVSITDNSFLLKYSSFKRLIHISAWIRRFIYNCKNKLTKYTQHLSCIELQAAENAILKILQQSTFPDEYSAMDQRMEIHRSSKLKTLNPFLDKHGIIRVGGRLENAPISYARRHPIILPHSHHITTLIIRNAHIETLHGNTALVINTIRDKYWILRARRTVTSILDKCIKCLRQKRILTSQLMGNLPSALVQTTKAFLKVGTDFAGPITIRASTLRNAKHQKAYICIFVCMATKAIHIELVSDLTAEAFVAALKRFVARRGKCTDLYSDCGTNFIGANRLLQRDNQKLKETQQKAGALFCAENGISWHFNPPSSPHFGGLWEAGVKSIKYHLRRVLGNATCTFEEYTTVLTQIEACLNSRPLCYIPNDPNDMFILTPGHFLIGQALNAIPETDSSNNHVLPSQRWKFIQHLNRQFWDRWSKDYLNQLQNRPKWQTKQQNIQTGEIVLVKSEQTHPTVWPLAIVEKVFPGQDGLMDATNQSTYDEDVLLLQEDIRFDTALTEVKGSSATKINANSSTEVKASPSIEVNSGSVPEVKACSPFKFKMRAFNTENSTSIVRLTPHTLPTLKVPAIINGQPITDLQRLRVTSTLKEVMMRRENTYQRFLTREGVTIFLEKNVLDRIDFEACNQRKWDKTITLAREYQVKLRVSKLGTIMFHHYHRRGQSKINSQHPF